MPPPNPPPAGSPFMLQSGDAPAITVLASEIGVCLATGLLALMQSIAALRSASSLLDWLFQRSWKMAVAVVLWFDLSKWTSRTFSASWIVGAGQLTRMLLTSSVTFSRGTLTGLLSFDTSPTTIVPCHQNPRSYFILL